MTARIHHAHLWGTRRRKYDTLLENDISTTRWAELKPQSPFYLFTPQDVQFLSEYEQGWKVTDVLPVNSVGIVTARDALTIRWSEQEVWDVVRDFAKLSAERAREKYDLEEDGQDWTVDLAQKDIKASGPDRSNVVPLLYRPFDVRFTYYTGKARGFLCRPRSEVMRHMLAGENVALISARSNKSSQMDHFFITRPIMETKCGERTTQSCLFPLYLYPDPATNGDLFSNGTARHVNLNPAFIKDVEERLRLSFVPDGTGDLKKTFGPENVFHYIYAVLHSPTYRERYTQFLKIDFPRVPITKDRRLFRRLCDLGAELVSMHLLEAEILRQVVFKIGTIEERLRISYPVPGDDIVEKGHPRYVAPSQPEPGTGKVLKTGRVYISKDAPKSGAKGQYFEGVPPEVWEFHIGGYQVCEKWLKDRRGRKLSYDDLTHYQKIVVALRETIRLMQEIDAAVPGWPLE